MSSAGGCDRAVRAPQAVDFITVQLFTKNNNQWKASPLTGEHVAAFREALQQTGIVDPSPAPYSPSTFGAGPDGVLWKKSIEAMTIEIQRCHLLGIPDLVVHPGSHMGQGEKAGHDSVGIARGASTRCTDAPTG